MFDSIVELFKGRFGRQYCLRCSSVALRQILRKPEIALYECSRCGRRYAKKPGREIHDAWPYPISLVLYPVIPDARPQEKAAKVAAAFAKSKSAEELRLIVSEIRDELRQPKQQVREILNMDQSEKDLREYLRLVTEELERIGGEDKASIL